MCRIVYGMRSCILASNLIYLWTWWHIVWLTDVRACTQRRLCVFKFTETFWYYLTRTFDVELKLTHILLDILQRAKTFFIKQVYSFFDMSHRTTRLLLARFIYNGNSFTLPVRFSVMWKIATIWIQIRVWWFQS